jgi:2-dehydro-3-deoxygluconokinase
MAPATNVGRSAAGGPEVIAVGEPLIALLTAGSAPLADVDSFTRHVAGAEANVAVGLARLGHRVLYVGRVGADGFGQAIVRRLRGEEVDVSGVVVDAARRTGLMVRERRVLGPSEVVYHRSGSAGSALEPSDVDAVGAAFDGAQWLHLTGITPALSESAHAAVLRAIVLARAAGVRVSFDVNLRRRLWSDQEAAAALHGSRREPISCSATPTNWRSSPGSLPPRMALRQLALCGRRAVDPSSSNEVPPVRR